MDETREFLSWIWQPGDVRELRALADWPTFGYFDTPEALAKEALRLDRSGTRSGHFKGIYTTLNPVLPDLLGRVANRSKQAKKGEATQDTEILHRRFLLVDADPVRPANINSTAEEHQAGLDLAEQIRADLADLGWPSPARIDTGNGCGLWYPIDLAAQDEGLVTKCLEALATRYSTPAVKVDTTVFNPARIARLPGTTNRKGDHIPARPQRRCRLLGLPTGWTPVPRELLEQLAATLPRPEPPKAVANAKTARKPSTKEGRSQEWLDAWIHGNREFFARHDAIGLEGPDPWRDDSGGTGRKWVAQYCPWNQAHNDGAFHIEQRSNGAISAGCHHNGCAGRGWEDLRDLVEPGWRDKKRKGADEEETQAQALLRLFEAAEGELWHNRQGDAFCSFVVREHREVHLVKSVALKRALTRWFYEERAHPPNADQLAATLGVLDARAQFDGPQQEVALRVAEHAGRLYVDLANEEWQCVEIGPDGWRVMEESPPIPFRRSTSMLPLPVPQRGDTLETLKTLRKLMGVQDEENWKLILAWTLGAYHPTGPFPVLVKMGEHGSTKSTQARMVRELTDPSAVPLRRPPENDRDLFIAAGTSRVLAFDNLSHVPAWLSDTLCCLATGGGSTTRQLYSDSEETLFQACRPCLLTGIALPLRQDLLDRSLVVHLPAIEESKRRPEAELWKEFHEEKAAILGAIFDVLASILKNRASVKLERVPRLADFAVWITAAEEALGWKEGAAMDHYAENRRAALVAALDADAIYHAVLRLMQDRQIAWEGTASQLKTKLEELMPVNKHGEPRFPSGWPRSIQSFGERLARIVPCLRSAGISVERKKAGKGVRTIEIVRNIETGEGGKGGNLGGNHV